MFHALLLVVAAFFAGMMVFAGWEAWLAYRAYLEREEAREAGGQPPAPLVTHAPPVMPAPASAAPAEATPDPTPAAPERHVDEEVLEAIASADHYLGESELDNLFGPTTDG